ncbi:MAG TPA: hypothetical protein VF665_00525 [Longimicrobium sp.]|jgi:hypothetical protein|uniref:hypothetical protein n=1 Tax=Longimicrobium sp. TaxID=2029185 RepID=UPI002ED9F91E
MANNYRWEAEFYEDTNGVSDVGQELNRIARSDVRGIRTIRNKIDLLRQQSLAEALQSKLIKRPSKHLYVLKVQSGPVSYRLPFFESPCRTPLIVFVSVEHRRDLGGDNYAELVDEAERLRLDWIARNCGGK